MRIIPLTAAALTVALAACGVEDATRNAVSAPTINAVEKPGLTGRMMARLRPGSVKPVMEWGSRDGSDAWTQATVAALESEGVTLLSTVPRDVMQYCPGYAAQTPENRAAFWAGLLSSVAKYESGWNPLARRADGRMGLMQISQTAADAYGCAGEMLDGAANMACAVRIMADQVSRDGAIHGADNAAGQSWLGAAKSWLPFRSAGQRAGIARFTSQQSYCR